MRSIQSRPSRSTTYKNDKITITSDDVVEGDVNGNFATRNTGGNDTFFGQDTHGNFAYGEINGTMSGGARGGDDTFFGGDGVDNGFTGDAELLTGKGTRGGDDRFYGGNDGYINDAIGDGNLADQAVGGDDSLYGGTHTINVLLGDGYEIDTAARGGDDKIIGGDSSLNIISGDGYAVGGAIVTPTGVSEELLTHAGDDHLVGGNGDGLDGYFSQPTSLGASLESVTTGFLSSAESVSAYSEGEHESGRWDQVPADGPALNLMFGDGYVMLADSVSGDDRMIGGDGAINVMSGDGYALQDNAVAGNDKLFGGDGVQGDGYTITGNLMLGDALVMDAGSTSGDDKLVGGEGVANGVTINLMAGDGYAAEDGAVMGDDVIVGGGAGTLNLMVGDFVIGEDGYGGADRFVIGDANEFDAIIDLNTIEGDKIDLRRLFDDDHDGDDHDDEDHDEEYGDDDGHDHSLASLDLASAISDTDIIGAEGAVIDLGELVDGATGLVFVLGWSAEQLIEQAEDIFLV